LLALKDKRVVVSVSNDLSYDQRVKRSCESLTQLGAKILVIGRLLPNSKPYHPSYAISRVKLPFIKGAGFYITFQIYLFWKLLFTKTDIYFSNDLDTLLPNFLVSKIKNKKLIYDTHELFTEVPELQGRWQKKVWLYAEKWMFPKLKNIITVNDSIANIYQKKYAVKIHVIRNIPFLHPLPPIQKNTTFTLILQGAGINVDRGAEELVDAMGLLDNVILKIVGNGDVIPDLKNKVIDKKLSNKIIFIDKCSPEELRKITATCHVGISLDKDTNSNYKFSLPNKLFDYIHAEIPVIASDLIEIKKIINTYNVGLVVEKVSPIEIAKKVKILQTNPNLYEEFCNNCKKAKTILNAQSEQEIFKQIVSNVQ
jgi:glycosyltransferase involved in cell wall biosynthesis